MSAHAAAHGREAGSIRRETSVLARDAFRAHLATTLGYGDEPLRGDLRLVEDLGLDSLEMFELILALDALGVELEPAELALLHTVDELYRAYVERVAVKAPSPTPAAARAPLVGRRAALRPVAPPDYDFLYRLSNDDRVAAFWRHRGRSVSPEQFAAVLWQSVLVQYLVTEAGYGERPLGLVAAYEADLRNGTAHLAMLLEPGVHGQGWPFEAGVLFLHHLFAMWPLRKLYAHVLTPIAETLDAALGRLFVEEGRLRAHEYVAGAWRDLHILAVHRADWDTLAGSLLAPILAGSRPTEVDS